MFLRALPECIVYADEEVIINDRWKKITRKKYESGGIGLQVRMFLMHLLLFTEIWLTKIFVGSAADKC